MKKLIRFDFALKSILRHKANFDVLEGFLSELLQEDITVKSILESESNKDSKEDKYNRVDLLVESANKKQIIIEVQCNREWDYMSRILYGSSKVVTQYLHEGSPYLHIKKVISISIVFFNLGEGKDYIYKGCTQFEGVHVHDQLTLGSEEQAVYGVGYERPADIFPEYYLLRVNHYRETIKNKFDEWMYFLKTEKIPPTCSARGLKSASKKLDVLKLGPQDRAAYERYQNNLRYEASMVGVPYEAGYNQGVKDKEAYAKEREQKAKQKALADKEAYAKEREQKALADKTNAMAKRMKDKGLPLKDIAAVTGLSESAIEAIQ